MDLIKQIFDSGVVGCGGAGFPTHVKLKASPEILIINGAECINKSYPNFFEDIQCIGGRIEVLEP